MDHFHGDTQLGWLKALTHTQLQGLSTSMLPGTNLRQVKLTAVHLRLGFKNGSNK